MITKRRARLALLACAGVASLGLLVGAAPAAAKNKTKTFNRCFNVGLPIPDRSETAGRSSLAFSIPVKVPKFNGKQQSGKVTKFNGVGLRINHTNDRDLQINLVSPGGRVSTLANRRGNTGDGYGTGSASCSGSLVQFGDLAGTSIVFPGNLGDNPIVGAFRPEDPLGVFVGGPAKGNWTLIITDVLDTEVGSLAAASLNFTYRYKAKAK